MKKKIIACTINILSCTIIDAAFIITAIYHEAPVSDYILIGIFLPIVDIAFLVIGSLSLTKSRKECLIIQLPDAVDDDSLPKLK